MSDSASSRDEIDAFDVLSAWPDPMGSVEAAEIAAELGVDVGKVVLHLDTLVERGAAIDDHGSRYSLSALGGIMRCYPESGRQIAEDTHAN